MFFRRNRKEGAQLLFFAPINIFLAVTFSSPTVSQSTSAPPEAATPTPPLASQSVQLEERGALLALKQALNNHPAFTTRSSAGLPWSKDPPYGYGYGNPSVQYLPCAESSTWAWITCHADRRVKSIVMDSLSLSTVDPSWGGPPGYEPLTGYIPWILLAPLERLTGLVLSGNNISGSLEGVSALQSLEILWLSNNHINGSLPSAPLNTNQASAAAAALPAALDPSSSAANITEPASSGFPLPLTSLMVDANSIEGSIPDSLSLLTRLTRLALAENVGLGGSFPASLGALASLALMDFHNISLNGTLPDSWSSLVSLTLLNLGTTLILPISDNEIIPSSWTILRSLQQLTLSSCSMRGSYPSALSSLPNISFVSLSNNTLSGTLPSTLWDPPSLNNLDISSNYFYGPIPMPADGRAGKPEFRFNAAGNCFPQQAAQPDLNITGVSEDNQRADESCNAFYPSPFSPPSSPPLASPQPAPSDSSSPPVGLIVGVVIGIVVLLLLCLLTSLLLWRRGCFGKKVLWSGKMATSDEEKLCAPTAINFSCREGGEGEGQGYGELGGVAAGEAGEGGFLAGGARGGPSAGSVAIEEGVDTTGPGAELGSASDDMNEGNGEAALLAEDDVVIEKQGAKEFSLLELQLATRQFGPSNFIGRGQYGEVYYGELVVEELSRGAGEGESPRLPQTRRTVLRVAVKKQVRRDGGTAGPRDESTFRNEIKILSAAYHRNLVALRGYCWEQGQLLLVYDYVPRGSLDRLLHWTGGEAEETHAPSGKPGHQAGGSLEVSAALTWQQRVHLAVGAAKGINFLHNGALQQILHLDIKCGNILVDDNFNAKVSDFGLSKVYLDPELEQEDEQVPAGDEGGTRDREQGRSRNARWSSRYTSGVRGTPGYVDPSCSRTCDLTEKSDVYSFGVVVLELATGWRPLHWVDGQETHIVTRVVRAVNTRGIDYVRVQAFGDEALPANEEGQEWDEEFGLRGGPTPGMFARMLCLGVWCCLDSARYRPKMRQVLKVLLEIEQGDLGTREEQGVLHEGKLLEDEFTGVTTNAGKT